MSSPPITHHLVGMAVLHRLAERWVSDLACDRNGRGSLDYPAFAAKEARIIFAARRAWGWLLLRARRSRTHAWFCRPHWRGRLPAARLDLCSASDLHPLGVGVGLGQGHRRLFRTVRSTATRRAASTSPKRRQSASQPSSTSIRWACWRFSAWNDARSRCSLDFSSTSMSGWSAQLVVQLLHALGAGGGLLDQVRSSPIS